MQISDFGLAVTSGNHSKGNIKLSGTMGYVAPEYLLDGMLFSPSTSCVSPAILFVEYSLITSSQLWRSTLIMCNCIEFREVDWEERCICVWSSTSRTSARKEACWEDGTISVSINCYMGTQCYDIWSLLELLESSIQINTRRYTTCKK